jgi:methylmalonyl-CoA mutase
MSQDHNQDLDSGVNDELALASVFDAAGDAEWRALVEKALKGKEFDKVMLSKSYDDIPVEALYTAGSARIDAQPQGREGAWDISASH